jgi:hypothetical protein
VSILKVKPPASSGPKLQVKDTPYKPPAPREDTPQTEVPAPRGNELARELQNDIKTAAAAGSKSRKSKQQESLEGLQSQESEQGVIGSMLTEPEVAIPVVLNRRISKWEFFNPIHQTLFVALIDMWESAVKVDLVTFTQYLRDQKILDQVGGAGNITQFFAFVPTAANVDYYIDTLFEKKVRRDLYNLSNRMGRAAIGVTEESSDELLTKFAGQYERMFRFTKNSGFEDAAHLLNGDKPVPPIQIVRKIVHRGSKLILGGGSKTQKTWALMALALSVSTGSDWWGFHTHRSRVCYINLELQDWSFHERLVAVASKMDVKPEEGWLQVLNLRGHAQSIEDLRRHFAMMLKSGFFALVIIDPVYKVLGGRDENKAGDVATLLNEVDRITVEVNAAVAMAAHFSKGNQAAKESLDRIGGSGVFSRDPDSILTMTPHEDSDCFTVESTLRNLPPISQFVVHWDYPVFIREEEKNPGRLKGTPGAKPQWSESHIIEQMSIINGWATAKLAKRLADEKGMSRATFYRLLTKLEDNGKIQRQEDGLWYKVSQVSQSAENKSENSETNQSQDVKNESETL